MSEQPINDWFIRSSICKDLFVTQMTGMLDAGCCSTVKKGEVL